MSSSNKNPDALLTAEAVQNNPACSFWLRDALRTACLRDPVDAVQDAEYLLAVLKHRLEGILRDAVVR